ncbi:MAG TPA: hypothetical protein VFT74_19255 [Isosphaeraceae bacterium]|nr:hypothetical protein [Isosphaeraceae bacterium]
MPLVRHPLPIVPPGPFFSDGPSTPCPPRFSGLPTEAPESDIIKALTAGIAVMHFVSPDNNVWTVEVALLTGEEAERPQWENPQWNLMPLGPLKLAVRLLS